MRRLIALLMMSVLLLAGMTAGAEEAPQCVTVMGFVYDKCGDCGVTYDKPGCGECELYLEVFGKMRVELLPLIETGKVKFEVRNTQQGQYRPEYHAYADAFGVSENELNVSPQFFIGAPENGSYLTGMESIDLLLETVQAYIADLPEGARTEYPADEVAATAALLDMNGDPIASASPTAEATAAPVEAEAEFYRNDDLSDLSDDDSVIVYVYKPNCEFCNKIKPLLEGLPDSITLPDGTPSRVVFVSLDKDDYDQYQIVKQYYEMLEIPEDHQYSPLVIVGDQYYMGYEEIVPNLLNALMAGDGVDTNLNPVLE